MFDTLDDGALTFGVLPREQIASVTGRAALQTIIDGRLPQAPVSRSMSFWLAEVGDGSAVFEGTTGPHLLNPAGGVHGGWALTLIDSACACAAYSLLPAGVGYASLETKANFTRPIRVDTGPVRCSGRVAGRGRQIITAEARLTNSSGELLAHGSSTVMVLR